MLGGNPGPLVPRTTKIRECTGFVPPDKQKTRKSVPDPNKTNSTCFFYAGICLALSLRRLRSVWATQVVQRNWRGYASRRWFQLLRRQQAACGHMQRVWRGALVRRHVKETRRRRDHAAALIQVKMGCLSPSRPRDGSPIFLNPVARSRSLEATVVRRRRER